MKIIRLLGITICVFIIGSYGVYPLMILAIYITTKYFAPPGSRFEQITHEFDQKMSSLITKYVETKLAQVDIDVWILAAAIIIGLIGSSIILVFGKYILQKKTSPSNDENAKNRELIQ